MAGFMVRFMAVLVTSRRRVSSKGPQTSNDQAHSLPIDAPVVCHHVFTCIFPMENETHMLQAVRHHVFRYIFLMRNDDHMMTDTRKARFGIRGVARKLSAGPC
mmetsp:Transcript_3944/g.12343  ORF Transcript_3944/g.12343 Transcript_3944/m.12343 type:complete len:103 (-) Transcript_3944:81-389(-)